MFTKCPFMFLSFVCLNLRIVGFKGEQYFRYVKHAYWISPCSFTATSVVCLFSLFTWFKYIFGALFSYKYYRTSEKGTKWSLS